MRVVNLSRRPFVNRRPILRIAALLWLAGAVLLAVNVRLYTGHWLGSAENRRLLAEVRQKLAGQQQLLAEQSQKFRRVNLDKRNRRAAFLNQLIDARTFPWSALFDDLEEVLPEGVRLVSVQPVVRLASNRRSRAQAERARTAATEPAAGELAQDEVELHLTGVAQSFDQLEVFVDRLFDRPFRDPYLSNTNLDPNQGAGATVFNLSAVYLTRREPVVEPAAAEPRLAEDAATASATDEPATSQALQEGSRQDGPRRVGSGKVERQDGPRAEDGTQMAAADRLALPESPPEPEPGASGRARAETPDRGTPPAGRSARPDARRGPSRPGQLPAGLVDLPDTPMPSAPEPEETPRRRPARRQAPRVPPDRPLRDPSPDSPPSRDDGPAFGDRDASSTPAILQQPRQLGSMVPAGPWTLRPPADGCIDGGAVA